MAAPFGYPITVDPSRCQGARHVQWSCRARVAVSRRHRFRGCVEFLACGLDVLADLERLHDLHHADQDQPHTGNERPPGDHELSRECLGLQTELPGRKFAIPRAPPAGQEPIR